MNGILAVQLLWLGALIPGQAAEYAIELGTASGQPGEAVEVPVFATFDRPLMFLWVTFHFDAGRLELLDYRVRGTAAEGANPLGLSHRTFGPGHGAFGYQDTGSAYKDFRVPPGTKVLVGKLRFLVLAAAEEGSAEVKPVQGIPETAGGTVISLDVDGVEKTFVPGTLTAGSVGVSPPEGPRPVGGLACEQILDRAKLSFTLTETYEDLQVRRDGWPVATLPATATGYTDKLPGLGAYVYSVTARRGGSESFPAACEILATSPAAPPVKDLSCGDEGLAWTSPVSYDRIAVFRDGELIAQLPGEAQSFVDLDRRDFLTVYTVVGELEGFRGPDVHCLDHGVWIMEAGDVQAPLGAERVKVPIYVTTSATVRAAEFYLQVDPGLDHVVDIPAALEGTEWRRDPEFLAMGRGPHGGPAAGIVYDYHNPREPEKDLPVGLRRHIINFSFTPRSGIADGQAIRVAFSSGGFTSPGSAALSIRVDIFIPGEVRFGDAGPAPVQGLAANPEAAGDGGGGQAGGHSTDVALSWRNGSPYETIRIERNGFLLAEVAGGSTAYHDLGVPPGVFTYKVVGLKSGSASFPARAFLSTLAVRGAFLRGDATRDSAINIADPVVTLKFLFLGGPGLPCDDAADANDDGRLGITDPVATLQYLFLGGPGLMAPGTSYPWFDSTPDGLTCDR